MGGAWPCRLLSKAFGLFVCWSPKYHVISTNMTYRPELGTYRPDFGRLRTVSGTVPVSAIEGPVLAHEHLQIDLRWPVRVPSHPRRWLDEERRVQRELADLREEHGLSLVVDLTGIAVG